VNVKHSELTLRLPELSTFNRPVGTDTPPRGLSPRANGSEQLTTGRAGGPCHYKDKSPDRPAGGTGTLPETACQPEREART
jgi:hypothetical protein